MLPFTLPADPICSLCANTARQVFIARGYPIAQCDSCGHRFLASPLQTDHVSSVYSDDYFFGGGAGYTNYLDQEKLLARRGNDYAKRVEAFLGKPGKVLDVGAAAGFLMEGWIGRHWTATGIEPNLSMVQVGQERGLDLQQGVFEEPSCFQTESFDCVSMIQVISHLPRPVDAMRLALKVLKPGGILLVETWDRTSWIARLMQTGWHEYSPPSVLHWFHLESLTRAASLAGFEFVKSRRSLRWLNVGHAKSLLKHMSSNSWLATIASHVAVVAPNRFNILYPGDDLFWAMYRKPIQYESDSKD